MGCKNIIVFDIGGTFFRSALFDAKKNKLVHVRKELTPSICCCTSSTVLEVQRRLLSKIVKAVVRIQKKVGIKNPIHLGISFAGTVSRTGTIKRAADLWGNYKNYPLKEKLQKMFPKSDIKVVNDVNAASWRYGKKPKFGKFSRICTLTVSSGIGFKVFNKKALNKGGCQVYSLGHTRVSRGRAVLLCSCGKAGHLAAYSSGRACEKRIRDKAMLNPFLFRNSYLYHLISAKVRKKIIRPEFIRNDSIVKAVLAHDPFCEDIFQDMMQKLARQIIAYVPRNVDCMVIIGGFAFSLKPVFHRTLIQYLKNMDSTRNWNKIVYWGCQDGLDGLWGIVEMYR